MAYFRAMSSAGGVTATITVTYDSTFYNKTMTCENGTKTYTKTTTSSGSTTFNVYEEGTWTITCDGISRTVNVVLSYSTQMAITKTVTVYGAVGATISFSDTTGSKTVTLDSRGQGSVSITFIPNQSITFTDTNVAKNPNNLSQKYSKAIEVTSSTAAIYVCPNNAIYWYGYEKEGIESLINPEASNATVTKNTNNILMSAAYSNTCGIHTTKKQTVNSNTKIKAIYNFESANTTGYTSIIVGSSDNYDVNRSTDPTMVDKATNTNSDQNINKQIITCNSTHNGSYYIRIVDRANANVAWANTSTIYVDALWLE